MDQIKIIDAGAGTGLIGVELKKLGYTNLCALDISAEMLREAKKKEVYTEFICTSLNGQSIPQIKSGQFDALILWWGAHYRAYRFISFRGDDKNGSNW